MLLFGGDTAYPVATAEEIFRRVVAPWNEVLREVRGEDDYPGPRILLGIPGNHDWYDGLDGFGRFFRRRPRSAERTSSRSARAKLDVRRDAGARWGSSREGSTSTRSEARCASSRTRGGA